MKKTVSEWHPACKSSPFRKVQFNDHEIRDSPSWVRSELWGRNGNERTGSPLADCGPSARSGPWTGRDILVLRQSATATELSRGREGPACFSALRVDESGVAAALCHRSPSCCRASAFPSVGPLPSCPLGSPAPIFAPLKKLGCRFNRIALLVRVNSHYGLPILYEPIAASQICRSKRAGINHRFCYRGATDGDTRGGL